MSDERQARPEVVQRSTRTAADSRGAVKTWLAAQLGVEAEAQVSEITSPSSNGLSSETLLFDATWREGTRHCAESFVARVEPDADDCPVFPTYDLEAQFKLLRLVRERTDVPVPKVRWLELDPSHLGAPFFVMERVAGRVPPDLMPYTFGSWLSEATADEQRRLQDESVGILAKLHSMEASSPDLRFLDFDLPGDTPLRRHFENQRRYYEWVRGERHHPILERTFEWLEAHWPEDEGETVVSWGDARIGNILYDGFEPSAVLDWEMAALAPREVDLGWMTFLHCFFDEIAREAGMPGMPDFMRPAEVAATYGEKSGHVPLSFEFYQVYAALRHGIVMCRVHERRVHFGEAESTDDPDAPIFHRTTLERMIDGSWWQMENR